MKKKLKVKLKLLLAVGSQHCVTKSYLRKGNIYCDFIEIHIICYFLYNSEILINK